MNETRIVFLGDSLTEYYDWSNLDDDLEIENQGISGDTTFGVLNRLEHVLEAHPKKVFLMIGINDLLQGYSKKDIVVHIGSILDKLKTRLNFTTVYVQSLLPVENQDGSNFYNEEIKQLNQEIRALAEQHKYPYVDLFTLMCDDAEQLKGDCSTDGLHLNDRGYRIWRDAITPFVHK